MQRVQNDPPAGLPDPATLGAQVHAPRRPRAADVLAVVTGVELARVRAVMASEAWDWDGGDALWERVEGEWRKVVPSRAANLTDVREAWELVAPPEWIGLDDVRRFYRAAHPTPETHRSRPRRRAPAKSPTQLWAECVPYPETMRACVTLASDPEGVATAEELAREFAARMAAWGYNAFARCGGRVLWQIESRAEGLPAFAAAGDLLTALDELIVDPVREGDDAFSALLAHPRTRILPAMAAVATHVRAAWRYIAAQQRGLRHGRRAFAERASPFEPLVAIWASGYAPVHASADAIVLGAVAV